MRFLQHAAPGTRRGAACAMAAPGTRGGRPAAAGFSMVEIAVTLAVLGLLAAIAIPSLQGLIPRVRLDNNTGILVNEIALARRQAIAQSVDYSIVFDSPADTYTLRKRQAGGWKVLGTNRVSGSDIVSVTGFSTAGTLVAMAGGAMNVPLSVGGSVNYGYITLQTPDGARSRRIRVEPLGRVAAEK